MWTVVVSTGRYEDWRGHTECIAIANFGAPASYQVDLVLGHARHLGVPLPDQLYVFVDLIRFDLVKHDRMHIFASRQNLGEGLLNLLVHLPSLFGAIDQRRQFACRFLAFGTEGFCSCA